MNKSVKTLFSMGIVYSLMAVFSSPSLSALLLKKVTRTRGESGFDSAINQNFDRIKYELFNVMHKTRTETVRGQKYFIEGLYQKAAEASDACLTLDADDGDDNADTWAVCSEAATNDLMFSNHTSDFLKIESDGDVLPGSDSSYDLGASGTEWQFIYVDTVTATSVVSSSATFTDATFTNLPTIPLTTGRVLIGNASSDAAEQQITGDVTISSSGVATVSNQGIILQLVSDTYTTTYSTNTTGSWIDVTDFDIEITPSSTDNDIKVTFCVQGVSTVANAFLRILRDATTVIEGDSSSSRTQVFAGMMVSANSVQDSGLFNSTLIVIDSPSTTSSVTYKLQVYVNSGGAAYINRSVNDIDSSVHPRGASTMILEEIGS